KQNSKNHPSGPDHADTAQNEEVNVRSPLRPQGEFPKATVRAGADLCSFSGQE
ncbi:MAG: hypothetical protein ACI9VR_005118, partial [Cognaticolwellia sp.]